MSFPLRRNVSGSVRAADGEATMRGWGSIPVRLVEVPVEKRTPVLLAYANRHAFASQQMVPRESARVIRRLIGLTLPVSEEEMKPLAAKFPVFRILPRVEG